MIINVILGGLGGLMVMILTNLRDSIKILQKAQDDMTDKLQRIEVLVAGNYVTKAEHDRVEHEMCESLRRIEEKLDVVPCKNRRSNDHNGSSYRASDD